MRLVFRPVSLIAAFLLLYGAGPGLRSAEAPILQEIIRRGPLAIQSDWASDPDFAYIERDEVQKNGTLTSRSYQVVEVEGSDYQLPIAISNRPLPPDRQNVELQ